MLSYSEIIKKSYYITVKNPILWLFGLFVIGGSNLSFLQYENIPLKRFFEQGSWLKLIIYFENHPGILALVSLMILILSSASILGTNFSRIIILLYGESILKKQKIKLFEQVKKSINFIWPIIKISLWTAGLMLLVAGALFAPVLFLDFNENLQFIILSLATLIFLPLAFAISCINIFTGFYLVLFKRSIPASINLGTDFFISRWPQILGLCLVLMVIYSASFVLGVTLLFIVKLILSYILLLLAKFNIFLFSAIIMGLKFVFNLLLLVLLGGLSVFFNQALLILFFELNTPISSEEDVKKMVASPLHQST